MNETTQQATAEKVQERLLSFNIDKAIPYVCPLIDGIIDEGVKVCEMIEDGSADDFELMLQKPRWTFKDRTPDIERVRTSMERMRKISHELLAIVSRALEDPSDIHEYIEEFLDDYAYD